MANNVHNPGLDFLADLQRELDELANQTVTPPPKVKVGRSPSHYDNHGTTQPMSEISKVVRPARKPQSKVNSAVITKSNDDLYRDLNRIIEETAPCTTTTTIPKSILKKPIVSQEYALETNIDSSDTDEPLETIPPPQDIFPVHLIPKPETVKDTNLPPPAINASLHTNDCDVCGKPLGKRTALVLEKKLHPECFKCSRCKNNIASGTQFFVSEMQPICSKCHRDDLTTCFECGKLIEGGRTITALTNKYHPDCFNCYSCRANVADTTFVPEEVIHQDDQTKTVPFCQNCHLEKYAKSCARCNRIISAVSGDSSSINVGDDNFHVSCFVCYTHGCLESLSKGAYVKKDADGNEQLFCNAHALG